MLGDEAAAVGVDAVHPRGLGGPPIRLPGGTGPRRAVALLAAVVGHRPRRRRSRPARWRSLALVLLAIQVACAVVQARVAVGDQRRGGAVARPRPAGRVAACARAASVHGPRLVRAAARARHDATAASAEIGRARADWWRCWRRDDNVMFAPISALLLWATHCAFAIEAWRARAGVAHPALARRRRRTRGAGRPRRRSPPSIPTTSSRRSSTGRRCLTATAIAHPAAAATRRCRTTLSHRRRRAPHCWSSADRTCRARARSCARSASTSCSRTMGAPVRADRVPALAARDRRVDQRPRLAHRRPVAVLRRDRAAQSRSSISPAAPAGRGAVPARRDPRAAPTRTIGGIGAEALLAGPGRDGAIGLVTTHDLALGEIAADLARRAPPTCTSRISSPRAACLRLQAPARRRADEQRDRAHALDRA